LSTLSTHALDTARGLPAAGLPVCLYRRAGDAWDLLMQGQTNADGRMPALADLGSLAAGCYRLHFATGSYFAAHGQTGLYPWVDVVFDLAADDGHYHVPLLLAPFGYSTYRGS
jgi:5-hydroxyisourate hydrolase